jgi:hypothetical protein
MTPRVVFFILSIHIIFSACKKNTTPTPVPIPEPTKPVLVYQWNFDGADALHDLFIEDASVQKNGVSVVADPLNPANKVCKTTLLKGNDRTELSVYTSDLKKIIYFYADAAKGFSDKANAISDPNSLGNEVWMSMKILKPQEQNTNGIKPCIAQLGPVSNAYLNPPVSSSGFCQLRMRNGTTPDGDNWNWRVFGGTAYTSAALDVDNSFIRPNYGKWEKFVFHCIYSTGSDGLIEVWKDGVRYINTRGANAIAFNRFRIKWGLYVGIGSSAGEDLTCYYDDIKIGDKRSSYDAISQ